MPASQEASCSTKPRANAAFRSAAAPAAVAGTSRPRMRGQGWPRDSRRDASAPNCPPRQESGIGFRQPAPAGEGKDALATAGETPALQTAAFGKNALLVYASPPPSTTSAAPVIQLAIGLTRNKTAFATSSGAPTRPSGRFAASRINACTSSPS